MSATAPTKQLPLFEQVKSFTDIIQEILTQQKTHVRLEEKEKELVEKLKTTRSSKKEINLKIFKLIDELKASEQYPLIYADQKILDIKDLLEAINELAKEGNSPSSLAQEIDVQETNKPEIKFERVDEAARLTFGDKFVEIPLEELEYRYVPQEEGKDETATYDQIMEAGWQALNKLNQGELFFLWQDYAPESEENAETNNVVNFFGDNESATTPDEPIDETPDYSKTTYIDTTPDLQQEQPIEKLKFEAYVDNDARLCISYDHGERKSPFGSAAKILNRFGISSVEGLKQKHLAELWKEDPSDWSYKAEVNNSEQWPELIYVFSKPDGSIILKLANRTRKIDSGIVTLKDIDFDSQDDLNRLWLSDKAYDYNPAQEKTEISSLSGKKPTRKRKPAEATV